MQADLKRHRGHRPHQPLSDRLTCTPGWRNPANRGTSPGTNWFADFTDPFTMINELFDPAVLTKQLRPLQRPRSHTANAPRRKPQRRAPPTGLRPTRPDMTKNDPPAAAWGIGTFREFFSARVGCQIYQPIYGFDLGSICLRP